MPLPVISHNRLLYRDEAALSFSANPRSEQTAKRRRRRNCFGKYFMPVQVEVRMLRPKPWTRIQVRRAPAKGSSEFLYKAHVRNVAPDGLFSLAGRREKFPHRLLFH